MKGNPTPVRVSRSGLLLTETLLAILFFSIASAVCLQLFGKTHTLSQRAGLLNLSVAQTNSVASLLDASELSDNTIDAVYSVLSEYYPYAQQNGDTVSIYFDRDCSECAAGDASYRLDVGAVFYDRLADYSMEMLIPAEDGESEDESVYQLSVTVYTSHEKEAD